MKATGRYLAGVAVLLALALAGCGGGSSQSTPAATAPAAAAAVSSSAPAGCDRAPLVLAAVKAQIDGGQIRPAAAQLRGYWSSLPTGTLRDDVFTALTALDQVTADAAAGIPVDEDAQAFVEADGAIARYCGA